jgi:NADH-quinone oxidoreductase subunit L
VGLCSFLLISFWFTDTANANAGRKAFIVNRIGDFGFILGIMLIFVTFGTLNFAQVFDGAQTLAVGGPVVTAITLLLFLGATGKSAQIPLYVWLPDAMAGPTPESALIHAATMVTAGVYMIARSHALYDLAPFSQTVVATVGAATAIFAALIAITQPDIKKVLAYSTVSQLGYMILGVGSGAYMAGVFHLYTHAFFKALLFLGAGSVMHSLGGEQDMRKMGGLFKYIRTTAITFIIGAIALAGIPPLAGFWSKDQVLEGAFYRGGWYTMLWVIGIITAGITAFYSMRQVGLVFFGEERWRRALAGGSATSHAPTPVVVTPPDPHPLTPSTPVAEGGPASTTAPGEKPKRPRPGQAVAASAPVTPSVTQPAAPAASTPADKPKRPRPGQGTASSAVVASHAPTSHAAPAARGHEHAEDSIGGGGHGHGGHGFSGEPHESPPSMTVPLIILMIGAVFAGILNAPGFSLLEHWLEPVIGQAEEHVSAMSPLMLTLIATLASVIGAGLGMSMYGVPLFGIKLPRVADPERVGASLGGLYTASLNKFYIDELYDRVFVQPFNSLATWFWQTVDKGIIDGVVNGVANIFRSLSGLIRGLQTGYVRNYAVSMVLGVVVLLLWFFFR